MVSSAPRPHFTLGKEPVPIVQEAGWAPGPVWTGGKSRPHWDSIPDRPARSQSLYRLSYPAHHIHIYANILDYLLQNQKYQHRNPKDDVKQVVKPKLVSSYPIASALNFLCKIYVWSLSFRVYTAVSLQTVVLWIVVPCTLIGEYQDFEGKRYLYFQCLNSFGKKNVQKHHLQINYNCELSKYKIQ